MSIPNLAKPFTLYVVKKKGIALGVCTQKLGSDPWPVANLSKKLDGTTLGWPSCLRAVAAAAHLIEEATKITLGQLLEVLDFIRSGLS